MLNSSINFVAKENHMSKDIGQLKESIEQSDAAKSQFYCDNNSGHFDLQTENGQYCWPINNGMCSMWGMMLQSHKMTEFGTQFLVPI